jgi:hypothetical protein
MAYARLRPLFAAHPLPAVVDAVLEARLGFVSADDLEQPNAARLSLGCYEVVGGDAAHPAARELVANVPAGREIVYGNDPAWRRLIRDVHGTRAADRPMRTYDPSGLDRAALEPLAASLPPGHALVRLDVKLAGQLDAGLEPHALQVFASPQAFVAQGVGFGVVVDGVVACQATSYTLASRTLEVAIGTRSASRGRGLAAAAAARLLLFCLDASLLPQWSASNPVSQRLALRLGFRPGPECEVLLLS